MKDHEWTKELPVSITVCDRDGIIIEMNDRAVRTFEKDGGRALIGTNVLDCHPEPSRTQLSNMLIQQTANTYTIEKSGVKKLIHQVPWYKDSIYAGFVEFAIELPATLPHFIRQSQ
jgi:transcriptional regulator with PAS, ATPase and Fis domain